MSQAIRQSHRWISMLFTLTVAANFGCYAAIGQPPMWVTMSPLPFLFLLMATGIYMFVQPYTNKTPA